MKVFLKIVVSVIILIGALVFIGSIGNEDKDELLKEMSKRHCDLVWETAADSIKEKTLDEFIRNDGIDPADGQFRSPSMVAAELLPNYVKYPETIMIDDEKFEGWVYLNSGAIQNLDEGLVTFSKNFIAKNKMNMDVRSRFDMTVKYQAGCKNFKLIDFVVN